MGKTIITLIVLLFSSKAICQIKGDVAPALGLDVPFSQGISVIDINNDGFDDLFITRRTRDNLFYLNNGDGTFTNIAESAGVDDVGRSALTIWEDFDQDGDQDFFLGMEEGNSKLYQNNGDLTFTDVSGKLYGIEGFIASAQWGDVNGDGWSDLFIFRLDGENTYLFSDQNGGFEDMTSQLGLVSKRLTMGAVLFDYDQDNDLDLYMTHDGYEGNHFYVNDGLGNFSDESQELGIYTETDAMGIALGDFDNDGWVDIYLTNLYENQLFKNNEGKGFEEIGAAASVDDYGMGWGTSWIDFDNNALLDLFVANDSYFSDYDNLLYVNQGNGLFNKSSAISDLEQRASYATAIADLNNDGREELLVANRGALDRMEVFEFEPNDNNWVAFKISAMNRQSLIGTKLIVNGEEFSSLKQVESGTSWAGENSDWVHFGTKNDDLIELTVVYPSGEKITFQDLTVGNYYRIEGSSIETDVKRCFEITQDLVTSVENNINKYINTYVNKYININILNNIIVNIYTYEGVLIYKNHFPSLERLDLSFLNRGMYLLQLKSANDNRVIKFFKE